MLTLTTYLDESQHAGPGHVVVAGFVGADKQWTNFATAWKRTLHPRPALHMTQLRWNDAKSERRVKKLLSDLATIPYVSGLCPVYGAAKVSDYFDLIENEPEYVQKVRGYVLCLSAVFSALVRDCQSHAVIDIVCEEQSESGTKKNLTVTEEFDAFRETDRLPFRE
jgi:hypothetical protein